MGMIPNFFDSRGFIENAWKGIGVTGFAGVMGLFLVIYIMAMFILTAFQAVSYVLHSLGLYTISVRRGIRHGWLSWVPVGSLWILGSISDQYQYVAKGKIKNRRKVLLWLSIAAILVCLAWFVLMLVSVFSHVGDLTAGGFGSMLVVFLGLLALSAVAITQTVFQYLAYYDLFYSTNPKNAVLFLVLSIVFPATLPFFVFALRKKDGGMPPRKQSASQEIPAKTYVVAEEEPEEVVLEDGFAQPEEFEEE